MIVCVEEVLLLLLLLLRRRRRRRRRSPNICVSHPDIRVLLVYVGVAVVAVVVLLPPHVTAGTAKVVEGGAKHCWMMSLWHETSGIIAQSSKE